ncbi:MAG TPA: iron-containing redox enzyme family protein [Nocardioidaceae bacterium]|nr:iron-containing redox enzyme family protein [Nocardioidaceae bacterium]
MLLPMERGPLSTGVIDAVGGRDRLDADALVHRIRALPEDVDVVTDDDLHLALWVMYELHYRGFDDAVGDWEWDPDLLRVRREVESVFEDALRRRTSETVAATVGVDGDVAERLFALTESFDGPSVARFVQREASLEQLTEFMVHRSVYHLKESDPTSWVIPRVTGKPKAALVELLYDEYGAGRPHRVHSTMFADALEACGLDDEYGAYLDQVPGYTLASNNAMSLLGLHRRLRAAALGHLGAFEATSSLPCRRFAGGIRRLGLPEKAAEYFDEHIEADAVHEQLALRDICAALVTQDAGLLEDVFFGAVVCLSMEKVAAERMLTAWQQGRTTLRAQGTEAVA